MQSVYLLLGSNLGDRETYLLEARKLLSEAIGAEQQSSSLYSTEPWGNTDQPEFMNQVVVFETDLSPVAVLKEILRIEQVLGRERKEQWGSRNIDIDILFYGDDTVNLPDLVIPHPQLHLRRFTLVPLAELAPDLLHPVLKLTVKEIIENLTDKLEVKKINR